ncbi:SGNH/GDSL hydrolase family protein [Sphingomonas sp. PB2P19]|uniref:SGNH/GDSL hydrolase family protein n=1 Tax=Sphingomonas rhamnosi TaxID=3096156 RepID=UPI002FCC78DB
MKSMITAAVLLGTLTGSAASAASITVAPVSTRTPGSPLPLHIGGRVDRTADGYRRQWPGTYFEAAFRGSAVSFAVGAGEVILHVSVDGAPATRLVRPAPGLYRVSGMTAGRHVVRVDVATESQAGPTVFGGFFAAPGTRALPPVARTRQIELIGDSHTVGYGNTASTRTCSQAEIWQTTDTTQGVAGLLARRYDADYQVNAISGRGVVRNYGGMPGDTVPAAYPYTTFDKSRRFADPSWHPRLIVIALGTNDFTTPLHAGEPWQTRDALHAAYEAEYVAFIRRLRARDPDAHILLWATDMADGEIAAEAARVVARVAAGGDRRIGFVPVRALALSACDAHPSTRDDARIATALADYVKAHPDIWKARR